MYFWLGFVVGAVLMFLYFRATSKTSGTLRIDRTNPDKDIFRFDVDDLDSLANKKKINLKVDNNAKLSQK